MKNKKILMALAFIAVVTGFCVLAIGAGKNNEQTYIGTWTRDGKAEIVVYPCHVGEVLDYYDTGNCWVSYTFSWEVDNGYLVMHVYKTVESREYIKCYLSNDGGKTMTYVTGVGGATYEKAD